MVALIKEYFPHCECLSQYWCTLFCDPARKKKKKSIIIVKPSLEQKQIWIYGEVDSLNFIKRMHEFWSSSSYQPETIISLHTVLVSYFLPLWCSVDTFTFYHLLITFMISYQLPFPHFLPKCSPRLQTQPLVSVGLNKEASKYLLTKGKIACMSSQGKVFKGIRIWSLLLDI